jgi:Putative zinc-finger
MSCAECQSVVEDYFDGELDEQTTEQVAQHLSACASCARLYEKLEGEQELYLRYECDAQPAPDFWDNVLARATEENTTNRSLSFALLGGWLRGALGRVNAPRLSPSLAALFVLVAVGLTIGVMRYANSREEKAAPASVAQSEGAPAVAPAPMPDELARPETLPKDDATVRKGSQPEANEQPPQLAKNPAGRKDKNPLTAASSVRTSVRAGLRPSAPGREQTSDELVREAEQKYVAAIAMLSRDVNRRRSRLDPETSARFAQTLAAVDRTIADTRRAARKHPGDPVAAQYMLTAYAKKVEVLREMIGY